jgi:cardiolipin synthase
LLIPWIGIPAYLVFGGRKLSAALMLKPPLGSTQPAAALPPGQAGADQLLQSYGLPRAQSGNRFSLCADGVDIYNRFIETIESAEKRIHMASFILHPDPVGLAVVEALARRARAGVEVRLLLDGVGSFRSFDPGWRRSSVFSSRASRAFHPHQHAQPS